MVGDVRAPSTTVISINKYAKYFILCAVMRVLWRETVRAAPKMLVRLTLHGSRKFPGPAMALSFPRPGNGQEDVDE
jgi:hypothetical protein